MFAFLENEVVPVRDNRGEKTTAAFLNFVSRRAKLMALMGDRKIALVTQYVAALSPSDAEVFDRMFKLSETLGETGR